MKTHFNSKKPTKSVTKIKSNITKYEPIFFMNSQEPFLKEKLRMPELISDQSVSHYKKRKRKSIGAC